MNLGADPVSGRADRLPRLWIHSGDFWIQRLESRGPYVPVGVVAENSPGSKEQVRYLLI